MRHGSDNQEFDFPLSFQRQRGNLITLRKGTGMGYLHPDAHYFVEGIDNYRFWLFYTPYPGDSDELPFLMRSNNGVNFTDRGVANPLLRRGPEGTWDDHHLADVDVVMVNGTWYLYYAGGHFENGQKQVRIGVATSNDGKIWTKYRNNPILEPDKSLWWENGYERGQLDGKGSMLQTPAVTYHDGTFFMCYSARDKRGIDHICLATSSDGYRFKKEERGPVLSPKYAWEGFRINHPETVYHNGEFWMYYLGNGFLGFARSRADTPTIWFKHQKPVLCPRLRLFGLPLVRDFFPKWLLWESGRIYRSSPLTDAESHLVLVHKRIYLYYSAMDTLLIPSIGLAKSPRKEKK